MISINSLDASIYSKCNYWNESSSGVTTSLNGVVHGNSKFVVVGDSGTILTSSNGTIWTKRISGTSDTLKSVAYGNNKFVIVGSSTKLISNNGIDWSAESGSGRDIIFGNNKFVIISGSDSDIAYGNGVYIHTRNSSARKSTDGTNWIPIQGTPTAYGIAYGNGKFIMADWDGVIYISSDLGTNWETRYSYAFGKGNYIWDIMFNGSNTFVATSIRGLILTSTDDGETWCINDSNVGVDLLNSAYGNSTYVAVGKSGTITTLINY